MQNSQVMKHAAAYLALWVVATLAGFAIMAVGVAIGALELVGVPAYTYVATPYPRAGLAVILIGAIAWKFGKAAAFLKVFTDAINEETARVLDTETLKSDMLSVLDERLGEMHQEITQTRRVVDRLSRGDAADEFDFGDELDD